MTAAPGSNSQGPGTNSFSVSREAKLYCDIISLLFVIVARGKQNILIMVLPANELHCIVFACKWSLTLTCSCQILWQNRHGRWRLTISVPMDSKAICDWFLCVLVKNQFAVSVHEARFFQIFTSPVSGCTWVVFTTT